MQSKKPLIKIPFCIVDSLNKYDICFYYINLPFYSNP